jgi:hypothetical protein
MHFQTSIFWWQSEQRGEIFIVRKRNLFPFPSTQDVQFLPALYTCDDVKPNRVGRQPSLPAVSSETRDWNCSTGLSFLPHCGKYMVYCGSEKWHQYSMTSSFSRIGAHYISLANRNHFICRLTLVFKISSNNHCMNGNFNEYFVMSCPCRKEIRKDTFSCIFWRHLTVSISWRQPSKLLI